VIELGNFSRRWSIILKERHIPPSDVEFFYISPIPSYATQVHTSYEEVDRDDVMLFITIIKKPHEKIKM
jgi:hypothetical protein